MFIPRDPVNENMFCQYVKTTCSGGCGDFIAYAGAVVLICDSGVTNGSDTETYVKAFAAETDEAFGVMQQSIKTGYHAIHPAGYILDKDFGMSHVVAQPTFAAGTTNINGTKATPVAVAHLGIWETTHYTNEVFASGCKLYAAANDEGRMTATKGGSANNERCIGFCMKGVTATKAGKNYAETTLYPIRIKLSI